MTLIDTHCHLDDNSYKFDLDIIIKKAREAGVNNIISIGTGLESSQKAIEISEKYPDTVKCSVGIDHYVSDTVTEEEIEKLAELAADKNVVAIGEIGLDYYHMKQPKETQQAALLKQLQLAVDLNIPVVIHTRDAHQDTLQLLRSVGEKSGGRLRGVIHCFSGDKFVMKEYLNLGYMISIAGHVTFKKAIILKEVAAAVPDDRLVLETDGPYLAPEPFRGKRNEPQMLADTARYVAELRNTSIEKIAEITTANAKALFSIK